MKTRPATLPEASDKLLCIAEAHCPRHDPSGRFGQIALFLRRLSRAVQDGRVSEMRDKLRGLNSSLMGVGRNSLLFNQTIELRHAIGLHFTEILREKDNKEVASLRDLLELLKKVMTRDRPATLHSQKTHLDLLLENSQAFPAADLRRAFHEGEIIQCISPEKSTSDFLSAIGKTRSRSSS